MSGAADSRTVLIVKNVLTEGPGTIEDHLRRHCVPFRVLELYAGEPAPSPDSFSHLVVLGGPMAVYERHRHPYLLREAALIEQAIAADRPVFGICLGAQMLAHVLGARVYAGPKKEIGWYDVALTEAGMSDPVTRPLAVRGAPRAEVFQWHGDTFDLPSGAFRLASSGLYANQAFRFGRAVYGLQFHIEVTPQIVRSWIDAETGIDRAAVHADSERIYPAYRERADLAYDAFFHA